MEKPISLLHARVGDSVRRMLAGTIPVYLTITKIEDGKIFCATPCGTDGWEFDQITGLEIDDRFPCIVSFIAELFPKKEDACDS